jgi:hypothetical protein
MPCAAQSHGKQQRAGGSLARAFTRRRERDQLMCRLGYAWASRPTRPLIPLPDPSLIGSADPGQLSGRQALVGGGSGYLIPVWTWFRHRIIWSAFELAFVREARSSDRP